MNSSTLFNRQKYLQVLVVLVLCLPLGCSSARETNETPDDPIEVTTTPATIQTDEQRQQIYNNGAGSNAQQLPKPNVNNKASETNRKKNIEEGGTDNPALTPNEVRPQQIKPRVDTVPGR